MAGVTELKVNGRPYRLEADPDRRLLWVLRDDLDLTGTKYGCGEGRCGACTVLVDGRIRRSCMMTVGQAEGREIVTIEGLATEGRLHPVQEAFLKDEALQCGYCTPGMILAATALLRANPDPSDAQIIQAMDGNICRCGVYPAILRAIRSAAESLAKGT